MLFSLGVWAGAVLEGRSSMLWGLISFYGSLVVWYVACGMGGRVVRFAE